MTSKAATEYALSTCSSAMGSSGTNPAGPVDSSIRAPSASTIKSQESQLLFSPSFLTCAGAILFRGVTPLSPAVGAPRPVAESGPAASASTWSPPSPPSLSSSSPSSSPAPRNLLHLATDRLKRSRTATAEDDDEYDDDEHAPPTPSSSSMAAPGLQVCIIYHQRKNEFLLAKGRKDQFETGLLETAMRETYEETGYPCRPLPVSLTTRAPLPGADIKDSPKGLPVVNCTEPFALTLRPISPTNVKLIYWFIAEATTHNADEGTRMPSESAFSSCWFGPEEAIQKLTHEHDKNVVKQAVELVRDEIAHRSCAAASSLEVKNADDVLTPPHSIIAAPPSIASV